MDHPSLQSIQSSVGLGYSAPSDLYGNIHPLFCYISTKVGGNSTMMLTSPKKVNYEDVQPPAVL